MNVTAEMIAFARAIRARDRAIRQWLGPRASYRPEEIPPDLSPAPTNEERSRAELIEFVSGDAKLRASYVGYLSSDRNRITTWVGDCLAIISAINSRRVRNSWLTDERGNFRALGIDGREYLGVHNGPGMYCTMRLRRSKQLGAELVNS
jgi:hypothetical protein